MKLYFVATVGIVAAGVADACVNKAGFADARIVTAGNAAAGDADACVTIANIITQVMQSQVLHRSYCRRRLFPNFAQ